MTTAIVTFAYDRPDLLERMLTCVTKEYPSGVDYLFVFGDGPTNPDVIPMVQKCLQLPMADATGIGVEIDKNYFVEGACLIKHAHVGIANGTNTIMDIAAETDGVDVIIRMDGDVQILKAGWANTMAEFMCKHPEIGILAPDLPGRYMRIHRDGYDEVEYVLGAVMAIRTEVYNQLVDYDGEFFDTSLHHQWDPDVCLRTRMLGYRIGVLPVGEFVDLGVGTGDSSNSVSTSLGGFEFLCKWNRKFLGNHYRYKSPYMLRPDEFPLNYLWRREWLAQFPYNERPRVDTIQDHKFEMIEVPITPSKWLLPQTRDGLRIQARYNGIDRFEKVDPELLTGKRGWSIGDLKRQENV